MWSLNRIVAYLEEWGVSVVQSGDGFSLRRPPGMSTEQFEFVASVVKSHIVPQREEFLQYVVPRAGDATPLYRNLPPAERRREDFRRLQRRADLLRELYGWTSRAIWQNCYDHGGGYLTAEHKAFPPSATLANLIVDLPEWARTPVVLEDGSRTTEIVDRFGKVLVHLPYWGEPRALAFSPWLALPASRPPPKWREYPGFTPPPDWHAPPGWAEREMKRRAAAALAERRRWYRENWLNERQHRIMPD